MIPCPVCFAHCACAADSVWNCANCHHYFQHPPTIAVRYDAAYLATYDRYPTENMSYLRLGFLKAFVPAGRLLDVGYGQGDFIRVAIRAGFDAYGCDVHQVDCGIREVNLVEDRSPWDVVTFFDSLEHFPDFSLVRSLAARARHVLVSLPATPAFFPDRTDWKHFKPGEHLHYFSLESLQRLFDKPLRVASHLEDAIRGDPRCTPNVLTAFFG